MMPFGNGKLRIAEEREFAPVRECGTIESRSGPRSKSLKPVMFRWFRSLTGSSVARESRVANFTGGTSLSKSVQSSLNRTGQFLKQRLYIWPILALLVLATIGWGVNSRIESTMRSQLESELETLLAVETAMLERWFGDQERSALAIANRRDVREPIYAILDLIDGNASSPTDARLESETSALTDERKALLSALAQDLAANKFVGFIVTDRRGRIIASSNEDTDGLEEFDAFEQLIGHALDGGTTVSPPVPSATVLQDTRGRRGQGIPIMAVTTPVRDGDFQVVGTLSFGIAPEGEFTEILQLGRMGESGETYAVDKQYRMVSNSRFTEDLVIHGLLPDEPDVESLLRVLVVDPGGDMTEGYRVTKRRSEMPPTTMAASVTSGKAETNVDGYNDYRGRPVIGAWKWLDKYNIGVTTEIDVAEAYRPLTILRWTFRGLMALLILTSIAIFVFTLVVSRLQREAQKAAVEAKQLGQYKLERKLGEGGMGVVYKGKHAMLRRPTAIKMLNIDKVNENSIKRFEKEVQITCQLNNPHTVAIYDYGRTPEGLFYYAMEFLNGIDLQDLVDNHGPQSEARTIHILRQMCESLYEAHTLGLVHRDIKPANTMLNRRGGVPDFVKVLDFGLVKAIDEDKRARQTSAGSLTGTPLYMSPESIQTPHLVDARSDIYAVGATGFFLLSGRPPFQSDSLVELCDMQVNKQPPHLRDDLGVKCSEQLEGVIMACLAKTPAQRPQTALDLSQRLERCPVSTSWTYDDGDTWWGRFERGQDPGGFASQKSSSDSVRGGGTSARTAADLGPSGSHDRTIIGDG